MFTTMDECDGRDDIYVTNKMASMAAVVRGLEGTFGLFFFHFPHTFRLCLISRHFSNIFYCSDIISKCPATITEIYFLIHFCFQDGCYCALYELCVCVVVCKLAPEEVLFWTLFTLRHLPVAAESYRCHISPQLAVFLRCMWGDS